MKNKRPAPVGLDGLLGAAASALAAHLGSLKRGEEARRALYKSRFSAFCTTCPWCPLARLQGKKKRLRATRSSILLPRGADWLTQRKPRCTPKCRNWRRTAHHFRLPNPLGTALSRPRQSQGGGREYTFSPFMGSRGLVPWRGVGQCPTSSWRKQEAGD